MYKTDQNGNVKTNVRLKLSKHIELKLAAHVLEQKLRTRVTMEKLIERAIEEFLDRLDPDIKAAMTRPTAFK